MIATDWIAFLVLDIGTPEIVEIPVGTRIAVGLLQAAAVRAAGFASVSLQALAPAVKYVLPPSPSSCTLADWVCVKGAVRDDDVRRRLPHRALRQKYERVRGEVVGDL